MSEKMYLIMSDRSFLNLIWNETRVSFPYRCKSFIAYVSREIVIFIC
jgi:hypothetical protein